MASTTTSVGAGGSDDNTTLAAITHILALFTWLIGPLVVFLVTDDEFVKANARAAINWQIWFTIYSIVAGVLIIVGIGGSCCSPARTPQYGVHRHLPR